MYSSRSGKFTKVDPIQLTPNRLLNPQALNSYQYVLNSPLKFDDPSGMELRFESKDAAKKRLELIRAGLPNEQRKAVGYEEKADGKIVLTIDRKVAEKAGKESLLGRLNNVVTSEFVAHVEFIKEDTKFNIVRFGIASETTLNEVGEDISDDVTKVEFSGLTLLENTFDREKKVYFGQVGINSDIESVSRLLISTEQSPESMTQAFFHESLAHFENAIEGDENNRKTGKNATHPSVNADARRIQWAVRENLKRQ